MKLHITICCILSLFFTCVHSQEQVAQLPFEYLKGASHAYGGEKDPVLIFENEHQYFKYYHNATGAYPQNFRFDFEKYMIVKINFSVPTPGYSSMIGSIVETTESIRVIIDIVPPSEADLMAVNHRSMFLKLKQSDKPVMVYTNRVY